MSSTTLPTARSWRPCGTGSSKSYTNGESNTRPAARLGSLRDLVLKEKNAPPTPLPAGKKARRRRRPSNHRN